MLEATCMANTCNWVQASISCILVELKLKGVRLQENILNRLHVRIKSCPRLPNVSWRILSSTSLMPNGMPTAC